MSAILLNNALLVAGYTPSQPVLISGRRVVLDFTLVTPGGIAITWYPEYTDGIDANGVALPLASWLWSREVAEEDTGNGDVRMPLAVRRFTTFGADGLLAAGTYRLNVQLQRTHALYRVQIAGAGVTATVSTPFGKIPST